jgi:anti-anti-sigma regulatory factor
MAAVQTDLLPAVAPPAPDLAPGEITIRLDGVFDGASAWELRHTLDAVRQGAQNVVLDFSRVREFYDFGVAVLAHGLAQRGESPRVALKGLRQHQLRMFRYFGVDAERPEAER